MSMRTRRARRLLPLILTCLLGAGLGISPGFAEDKPSDDLPGDIDRYLTACHAYGWSGSVIVAHEGKVLLRKGYGLADRSAKRANDATTLFEIASISKVITACGVMRLVELDRLKLDDPIHKHLPDVPKDKHAITVRHLLTHTSGVSRMVSGGGADAKAAVAGFLGKPLTREPGRTAEYWNGGYALLAAIIESASGTPYPDFLRAEVFARAGMKQSGFTGDTQLPRDIQARGYDGATPLRRAAEHPYGAYDYRYRGMGGVVTSADDMWRFTQALLANKILSADTRKQMEVVFKGHRGIGWGVLESTRGTPRLVHGGDVRGFHCAFEVLPKERAAIIVLSNVGGVPTYKLQWTLNALLFNEMPRYRAPALPHPLPDEEIEALLGRWVSEDGADALHIVRKGIGLEVSASGLAAGAALAGEAASGATALVAKTQSVFAAIQEKDQATIRSALPKGVFWADTWPKGLVERIWPKQVAEWGALKDVRVIGAAPMARGMSRVVLGLRHEKAERSMEVLYSAGGDLTRLTFDGPRFALTRPYMPSSRATFLSFDWNTERPAPKLTIRRDAEGKPTSIAIRDLEFFRK